MKALILNALAGEGGNSHAEEVLKDELKDKGWQYELLPLGEMEIKPCLSCGTCATRTPGICPQKDGMDRILADWVQSRLLVFLTPVSFGGYHSRLKKVVDRVLPIKTPFFTVYRGELHHQNRYKPMPSLLTIGILEGENVEEREVFNLLTKRNAVNMFIDRYAAVTILEKDSRQEVRDRIQKGLTEVV